MTTSKEDSSLDEVTIVPPVVEEAAIEAFAPSKKDKAIARIISFAVKSIFSWLFRSSKL